MATWKTSAGLVVVVFGAAAAVAAQRPTPFPQEPRPRPEPPAGSFSWADYDADRVADAYVVVPGCPGRLYRGVGAGALEDVTELAGLADASGAVLARWGDPDGDGLPDLLLVGATVELWRNTGDGTFDDATALARLDGLPASTYAEWLDYDADGLPDLAVSTVAGERLFRNAGAGTFEEVLDLPRAVVVPERGAVRGEDDARTAPEPSRDEAARPGPGGRRPVAGPPAARGGGGGLAGPGGPDFGCLPSLLDQATGNCLGASSVPALGSLYPISGDLFVDPGTGHVGLGTTTPDSATRLTVGLPATGDTYIRTEDGKFRVQQNGYLRLLPSVGTDRAAFIRGEVALSRNYLNSSVDTIVLTPHAGGAGRIEMRDTLGAETILLEASEGGGGNGAQALLRNAQGKATILLDADHSEHAGRIDVLDGAGSPRVKIVSDENVDRGALLHLLDASGQPTVILDSSEGSGVTGAKALFRNAQNHTTVDIDADYKYGNGRIGLADAGGTERAVLAADSAGGGAYFRLDDGAGRASVVVNARDSDGLGRVTCDVLEIKGGADLVEGFQVSGGACAPGTVVVIDPASPGRLAPSSDAYDRKVAGVVSGAGGVRPGLHMGQEGVASGDTPVALTGRVYVRCSVENGPIAPGDSLTTASLEGHAMRATDTTRSNGALLGKAMSSLDEGTGLVLVLVNLQ